MTRLIAFAVLSVFLISSHPAAAQEQQAVSADEAAAPLAPAPMAPSSSGEMAPVMHIQQMVETAPPQTEDVSFDPEEEEIIVPQKTDADVTVMKDPYAESYVKGTPGNLSKLYWRLRVFDLDDDVAVDNYMLINECDLYQRYINDDFEWTKLRDAARQVLKNDRDKFTNKFMFILPVKLGRYDTERGGFHLVNNTHFDNVRRMEISGNSLSREICGKTGEIKDYPRNLMLILTKGFSYDFAKVDEHVAQAYIIRKQKEVLDIEYGSRQARYNRIAYVRLRVNFDEYQGNVKGQDAGILSILYGKLEGIDMFEDPYGKMLLSMGPDEQLQQPVAAAPAADDLGEGVRDVIVNEVTPASTTSAAQRTGKPLDAAKTDAPPPANKEAPTLEDAINRSKAAKQGVPEAAAPDPVPTPPATGAEGQAPASTAVPVVPAPTEPAAPMQGDF